MSFMRIFILLVLAVCSTVVCAQSMDLEKIRVNYDKAVSEKNICRTMIEELRAGTNSAIQQAYLGAFQTIWAKHVINPFSKLKTFNKGKRNIDEAVKTDPNNAEIRFVRLSVQVNCPSFLGYSSKINEDKKMVQMGIQNIKSVILRKMMATLI